MILLVFSSLGVNSIWKRSRVLERVLPFGSKFRPLMVAWPTPSATPSADRLMGFAADNDGGCWRVGVSKYLCCTARVSRRARVGNQWTGRDRTTGFKATSEDPRTWTCCAIRGERAQGDERWSEQSSPWLLLYFLGPRS